MVINAPELAGISLLRKPDQVNIVSMQTTVSWVVEGDLIIQGTRDNKCCVITVIMCLVCCICLLFVAE